MKTDKELIKENPGKCPKMDCVNKVVCSADYPNELCFEPKKVVVPTLED